MKKYIEKARKEFEDKETLEMIEIINNNRDARYNKWLLNQQVRKITKEKKQKKEKIINFIVIIFVFMILLGLMISMLVFLEKDTEQFMKGCTASGNSESYCRSQL